MSHTSTISSILITDVNALKSAITELKQAGVNCDLLEDAVPRAYSRSQAGMGQAPYVVKLSNYDVGLYLNKDKSGYEARTDFWDGSVERDLGVQDDSVSREQAMMGKLYQMYGVHATTRAAAQKGYRVTRHTGEEGKIQLRIAA